jgi:hypothetical protein
VRDPTSYERHHARRRLWSINPVRNINDATFNVAYDAELAEIEK